MTDVQVISLSKQGRVGVSLAVSHDAPTGSNKLAVKNALRRLAQDREDQGLPVPDGIVGMLEAYDGLELATADTPFQVSDFTNENEDGSHYEPEPQR